MGREGNDKGFSAGSIKRVKMAANSLYEEVIIAGFGGQGILLAGKLLAHTAMKAGKEVTFMPSYGAEMRGGTANCMVIIAAEPIASPLIVEPGSLIAMNKASVRKFAPRVKPHGLLIINSSLMDTDPEEYLQDKTIEVLAVPADDIANELGSPKSANMVALGAYLQKRGLFTPDAAAGSLAKTLAKRYHKTLSANTEALQRGAESAKMAR